MNPCISVARDSGSDAKNSMVGSYEKAVKAKSREFNTVLLVKYSVSSLSCSRSGWSSAHLMSRLCLRTGAIAVRSQGAVSALLSIDASLDMHFPPRQQDQELQGWSPTWVLF